jgi:hypothetical protein
MDNDRPELDMKHFEDICPDKNGTSKCDWTAVTAVWLTWIFPSKVPVIAVFTKYDQFRRDVKMKLQDQDHGPEMDLDDEVERMFDQHYLASFTRKRPPFIRLQSECFGPNLKRATANSYHSGMHRSDLRCTELIEITSNTLRDDVVAVMLLAVQKDNLELSIKQAVKWYVLM